MSNEVKRLKQLLLDDEHDQLTEIRNQLHAISQRLGQSESVSAEVLTKQATANARLDVLHERVGTQHAFEQEVAVALSRTLAEAPSEHRDELVRAIAPVIAEAVRSELSKSDEQIAAQLEPVIRTVLRRQLSGAARDGVRGISQGLTNNRIGRYVGSRLFGRQASDGPLAATQPSARFGVLTILLSVLGVSLLAWLAWMRIEAWETRSVEEIVQRVIEDTRELTGYRTGIEISDGGQTVVLTGLVPSSTTKTVLLTRLETELPNSTRIVDRLQPLPYLPTGTESGPRPDLSWLERRIEALEEGIIDRAVTANLTRAGDRLEASELGLKTFSETVASARGSAPPAPRSPENLTAISKKIAAARITLAKLESSLRPANGQTSAGERQSQTLEQQLVPLLSQMDAIEAGVLAALGSPVATPEREPRSTSADSTDPLGASHGVARQADRIADAVQTLVSVSRVETAPLGVTGSAAPVAGPSPTSSPREALINWTRAYAVFFTEGTSFRAPERVALRLDELAKLINAAGALVRIVGYTDEQGGSRRNNALARARAETVRDELVARGVPAAQLVAVGRADARDLSADAGPSSPNRRVEFEVGFIGEVDDIELVGGTTSVRDLPTDR